MHLPRFEELYVVSDLHLGGTSGEPIFRQGAELASLIQRLAQRTAPHAGALGLVLDGDIIDSLAEPIAGYVASPAEAEDALVRIFGLPAFKPVWDALADFVHKPQHRLIVVLGNHDLELAFPNVQEQLLQQLAGHGELERGRISFATAGFGYRCEVGSAATGYASVLCIHGNEFDTWNAVSPESMARLGRASILGKDSALSREPPNAGTKLVKDVMNGIKRDWPFVDLLKPEIESVFNVVLALEPKRIAALGGVLQALGSALTVGRVRTARILGETGAAGETGVAELAAPVRWKPGQALGAFLSESSAQDSLLDDAWKMSADSAVMPEDLAEREQVLGGGQLLLNTLNFSARRLLSSPREALRAAFADWGGSPETWALDGPCEVFDKLAELAPDADVVVAGHTHLRRQRQLPGGALYLNTGTWARLMRLTGELLSSEQQFTWFWEVIRQRSMAVLDRELTPRGLLMNQPNVAVIRADAQQGEVQAALCEYRAAAPDYDASLIALQGGHFTRVASR